MPDKVTLADGCQLRESVYESGLTEIGVYVPNPAKAHGWNVPDFDGPYAVVFHNHKSRRWFWTSGTLRNIPARSRRTAIKQATEAAKARGPKPAA